MTAAVRAELTKLGGQLWPRLVLATCALAPAAFAVVMRAQHAVPSDTLFGRWARTTGFATSLTALGFACSLGFPFLAGVVGGDAFAGEDRHGTWKTILTRSTTLGQLFVAKAATAIAVALACVIVVAASSVAFSLAIVGHGGLVGLSGQLVPSGSALALVAASWALSALPLCAFVALALLLSIATRSAVVATLGTGVAGLALQLVSLVGSARLVRVVLPTSAFDAWHGLFTAPPHYGPAAEGAASSVVYCSLFLASGWLVLRRRTFAGADAVPEGRWRVPVRTAAALGAVTVALLLVGDLGPTDITAPRLDAAVAPTFERLVILRYRWLTHGTADPASARVAVACSRGSGTRTSRGAGDDWSCVVRALGAPTAAVLTLELTVRANGCYTAQGPPSITGGPRIRAPSGALVTNPLYAFDGCLGTA